MAPLCVIDADGEGAKVELHAGESVWLPGGGGYGGGSKTTAGSGEGVSVRRCGIASCGSFGAAWALDVQAGQRGSATSAMVAVAPREHASPAHIYNEPAECGGSVQLWVLNETGPELEPSQQQCGSGWRGYRRGSRASDGFAEPKAEPEPKVKRPRGRPRKYPKLEPTGEEQRNQRAQVHPDGSAKAGEKNDEPKEKRPRGRPRKHPKPEDDSEPKEKRPRGRPRKHPKPEDERGHEINFSVDLTPPPSRPPSPAPFRSTSPPPSPPMPGGPKASPPTGPGQLVRVLRHAEGPAWDVKWRPGKQASGVFGQVAVAFGSGRVCLYGVPASIASAPRTAVNPVGVEVNAAAELVAVAEKQCSAARRDKTAVPCTMRWDADGERLLVGYQDGAVAVWAMGTTEGAASSQPYPMELLYSRTVSRAPLRGVEWLGRSTVAAAENRIATSEMDDLILCADLDGNCYIVDLRESVRNLPTHTHLMMSTIVSTTLFPKCAVTCTSDDGNIRILLLERLVLDPDGDGQGQTTSKTRHWQVADEAVSVWSAAVYLPPAEGKTQAGSPLVAYCTHAGTVCISNALSCFAPDLREKSKNKAMYIPVSIEARRIWDADKDALVLGGSSKRERSESAAPTRDEIFGHERAAHYCASWAPASDGCAWLVTGGQGHFMAALVRPR